MKIFIVSLFIVVVMFAGMNMVQAETDSCECAPCECSQCEC